MFRLYYGRGITLVSLCSVYLCWRCASVVRPSRSAPRRPRPARTPLALRREMDSPTLSVRRYHKLRILSTYRSRSSYRSIAYVEFVTRRHTTDPAIQSVPIVLCKRKLAQYNRHWTPTAVAKSMFVILTDHNIHLIPQGNITVVYY